MLRFAHISDIHIRGLSRHDEYRVSLQKFCDDCRENSVDHVFIGGDTWHTKTSGISPEYIDFLSWFLVELSKTSKIHIILGNHDMNLCNLSRQDAITPIVNALNNENIFLYKKSGVYEFHPGYVWCIFSLYDEENWENVKPIEGKVNIACYHGSVRGCLTEVNWEINEGLPVNFFDSFDFVFLGDIHKKQFLGFRDVEIMIDEKDLDLYPGAEIIEEIS
jgi:DNA repair exonuclease SbcCD nuclease subunit